MKVLSLAVMFLVVTLNVSAQRAIDWAKADSEIVRLVPSTFSELPQDLVKDLEKRGCTIPQSYAVNEPHNAVGGEFRRKGQQDWAILCSINQSSSILVYWNSSPKDISRIANIEDSSYLQDVGFSRLIEAADAEYILSHYKAYGGTKPPKLTHQGINDIYAEKASGVHYLHRGKWLRLQGAD